MAGLNVFRELALSFPGTTEVAHFDRLAFRTARRIFATIHPESLHANLKLPLSGQDVFSLVDKSNIYPVANKWGLQGWTTFEIEKLDEELLFDALKCAYEEANRKKDKK